MNINELVRENIRNMKPYSCARDEFKGKATIYLDANENPFNSPFNRYPDPHQTEVKERIAELKGVRHDSIFLGNGSDEAIDLLYRAFCEPRVDNVVAIEPTYGMYKVCADVNDVEYRKVLLNENFDFEAYNIMDSTNARTKIMWLCSPNNPTGNNLNRDEIIKVLQWFRGIVVIDEAYADFSEEESFVKEIKNYTNLVVLQTFSKAWGNAAARLGMAFASPEIIDVLNKIKYPYNISLLTQRHAMFVMQEPEKIKEWVETLLEERRKLITQLKKVSVVEKIYPTNANFVLVKVTNAKYIYRELIRKGIVVRNRSNIALCDESLRITVGTADENKALINELKKF